MHRYKNIVDHYEKCFEKFGDECRGVDWPDLRGAEIRYEVMLDLIPVPQSESERYSLLDFGCGCGHLYDYMKKTNKYDYIDYTGLDISEKFASHTSRKGLRVIKNDLMKEDLDECFDYIVFNGVFTEKCDLGDDEMFGYFTDMILKSWPFAKKGMAFNVMSKNVDWERDDLFHLSMDKLTDFLFKNSMKNFVIRNDYGLYEYTTYLYKETQCRNRS